MLHRALLVHRSPTHGHSQAEALPMDSGTPKSVSGSHCSETPRNLNDATDEEFYPHIVLAALKASGKLKDIESGQTIHCNVVSGQDLDLYIATTLDALPPYGIMECLDPGICGIGEAELALQAFVEMETVEGCTPDSWTFIATVMACVALAAKEEGKEVEGRLVKTGCLETGMALHSRALQYGYDSHIYLASILVDLYAKCGSMGDARSVFDKVAYPDVVLWTTLMLGYVENGQPEVALQLFSQLQPRRLVPDDQCFLAALMACVGLAVREEATVVDGRLVKVAALKKGMTIHCEAAKRGYERNIYLAATLVDMYAKCGSLVDARRVFERTPYYNVVLWNAFILGCVENGEDNVALELFSRMTTEGRAPDLRTYVAALMACAGLALKEKAKQVDGRPVKLESLEKGMALHSEAARRGFDRDVFVACSLVDMYSRCGSLLDARNAFDRATKQDTVLWNSLIQGHSENGEPDMALQLFSLMQSRGVKTDSRTFVAALVACASLAALETGKQIHADICRRKLQNDRFVANSLVVFYGKCGSMAEAEDVFKSMSTKDLVAWNALMSGYSRQGDSDRVFYLFERMRATGVQADGFTFLSVLAACSHAGLVDEGKEYFSLMVSKLGVTPDLEHYHCMIDLLGRANRLDEAMNMVRQMPYEPTAATWNTILAACRKWRNAEIGKVAFESLVKLDGKQSSPYVLMAEIYKSC